MVRAFVANLRAGHNKEGASTITQQVVKNFLLTPEKTFKRKIQEIILARRLEKALTKEDIMTLYLNQIYFGANRYGIEERPRRGLYFGKHAWEISVGEAAVLASLPKEPEPLSRALLDGKHPERIKDRQTYVLNQMVVIGKLKKEDAQKWIDDPIHVVEHPFPALGSAPEFVELAHKELLDEVMKDEPDKKAAEEKLEYLGAHVRTTLDPGLQVTAVKALQDGLRRIDADKKHLAGRPIKELKGDKIDLEIATLAKKLPAGGPIERDEHGHPMIYDAVVTGVHDDKPSLDVDLGKWQGTLSLAGEDEEERFNPKNAKPSERFKPGSVIEVEIANAAKHDLVFAPGPEGAIVVIDIKTRKVRVLVGGFDTKPGGFDRATMARRQPGSTFKPIIYGAAIEKSMKDSGRCRVDEGRRAPREAVHARARDGRRRAAPRQVDAEELRRRGLLGPRQPAHRAREVAQRDLDAARDRRVAGQRRRLREPRRPARRSGQADPGAVDRARLR